MRATLLLPLLSLGLAGCTQGPAPLELPSGILEVHFYSAVPEELRLLVVTTAADGQRVDERTVRVPAFARMGANHVGRGPSPWTVDVDLPNGTRVTATADAGGGDRYVWVYLQPEQVLTVSGRRHA